MNREERLLFSIYVFLGVLIVAFLALTFIVWLAT
jgi:hypothetical protein